MRPHPAVWKDEYQTILQVQRRLAKLAEDENDPAKVIRISDCLCRVIRTKKGIRDGWKKRTPKNGNSDRKQRIVEEDPSEGQAVEPIEPGPDDNIRDVEFRPMPFSPSP